MSINYCPLHTHTEYSTFDGIMTISEYIETAKKYGIKSLAITDHGTIDGAIKFYLECVENDIKPIIGVEAYIVENIHNKTSIDYVDETGKKRQKRDYKHICLWAKSWKGVENIIKMLNIAYNDGFYYKPRIDFETLINHKEEIIVGTACCNGILSYEDYEEKCRFLKKEFGDDFYIEIMPLKFQGQKIINERAVELSKQGYNIILTNDIHYLNKNDKTTHEVYLAIGDKSKFENRRTFEDDTYYFQNPKELYQNFVAIGIDNDIILKGFNRINELVNKVDIKMPKMPLTLPKPFPEIEDERKYLRDLAFANLEKMGYTSYPNAEEYIERLNRELEVIFKTGFERYFLVVMDIVQFAKKYMAVGDGRGSGSGCLLAHVLGIIGEKLDPIKYGLIFERFYREGRADAPDLDIDFSSVKREMVFEYIKNKYGQEKTYHVSTFQTMKGKNAFKDVCKVFSVPYALANDLTKSFIERENGHEREYNTIEDTVNSVKQMKDFAKKYPEVIKHAQRLEGKLKSKGIHAAGIIITDDDLRENVRGIISKNKDGRSVINWDVSVIDKLNLMKMDCLGLSTLSEIEMTEELLGYKPDYDYDDPKYAKMVNNNTSGLFQLGTPGMTNFMKEIEVNTFHDIVAITALFRPGVYNSGWATKYCKRKAGKEKISYENSVMEKHTKETYGVILYQEQIMFVARDMAGFTWSEADMLRKVIAKSKGKEAVEKFRKQFVDGSVNNGFDKKQANEIFDNFVFCGNYLFNKSHAVAYSMITYKTIILRAFKENAVAILNLMMIEDKKDITKIKNKIDMLKKGGFKILYPHINKFSEMWVLDGDNIRMGMQHINSVGKSCINAIKKLRKDGDFYEMPMITPTTKEEKDFIKNYKDFITEEPSIINNFVYRIYLKKLAQSINRTHIQIFKDIGAFGDKPIPRIAEQHFSFPIYYDKLKVFDKNLKKKYPNEYVNLDEILAESKIGEFWTMAKVKEVKIGNKNGRRYLYLIIHNEEEMISFVDGDFYNNYKSLCESLKGKIMYFHIKTKIWKQRFGITINGMREIK